MSRLSVTTAIGFSLAAVLITRGLAAQLEQVNAIGVENEYADVVAEIGGKYIKVESIMSRPNIDPHDFEANPKVAREIAAATPVPTAGGRPTS